MGPPDVFLYDSSGNVAGTFGDLASSVSSSIDSSLVPYAGQLAASGSPAASSGMSTSTLMLIAGGLILAIVLLGGKR